MRPWLCPPHRVHPRLRIHVVVELVVLCAQLMARHEPRSQRLAADDEVIHTALGVTEAESVPQSRIYDEKSAEIRHISDARRGDGN
jgi:hypothetical protein